MNGLPLHRYVAASLLDFALPTDCFACGRPLTGRQSLGACPACWSSFRTISAPFCPACGEALPRATDLLGPAGGRCPGCVLRPSVLARTRAAVVYDALARAFVLRGKLAGRDEVLRALGARLGSLLAAEEFARPCEFIVAVPSHPWIRLRRGFDPAREIARGVAGQLDLPVRAAWLRRRWRGLTVAKRLPGRARAAAVKDAFRAGSAVRGARVLLVDDVRTTGATLSACALALTRQGAVEVRAAVFAATPRSGESRPVREVSRRL